MLSLPGMVLSTKTREFKVFFQVFEQHRYYPGMNTSQSLKAKTQIIFCCSAILFLPLLFALVYIKKILPLQYCRGFVFLRAYFVFCLSVNSHAFNLCYISYVTCG